MEIQASVGESVVDSATMAPFSEREREREGVRNGERERDRRG